MAPMPPTTDVSELSYEQARDELVQVVSELEQGSATLDRGYAIVQGADGHVVTAPTAAPAGAVLTITLAAGAVTARSEGDAHS